VKPFEQNVSVVFRLGKKEIINANLYDEFNSNANILVDIYLCMITVTLKSLKNTVFRSIMSLFVILTIEILPEIRLYNFEK